MQTESKTIFLQSPAIAEDLIVLVVLFFPSADFFDVTGPIFAKLCHTVHYVLK